jgi:hypothetical protein
MEIRLNLNETITCKLTDQGLKIYIDYLNSIIQEQWQNASLKHDIELSIKKVKAKHKDKIEHEFQLHEFMRIFGSHMIVGSPQYIQDNNIII